MIKITEQQVKGIVNSFKRIFTNNDIEQLTVQAYRFIHIASGFIAHYNIYGFRVEYENVETLKDDILFNQDINQWDNFHPGQRDYDYMMQKRDIYNQIVEIINP